MIELEGNCEWTYTGQTYRSGKWTTYSDAFCNEKSFFIEMIERKKRNAFSPFSEGMKDERQINEENTSGSFDKIFTKLYVAS